MSGAARFGDRSLADRIAAVLNGYFIDDGFNAHVAAEIAAAVHPTIGTVDQLDALPEGSVILTVDGVAFQRSETGMWFEAGGGYEGCGALAKHGAPIRLLWTGEES